jgi:secernin
VAVIARLLEAHGQGGSALGPGAAGYHNSFAVEDPAEAWLVETSGRRFAARRARRDALSNHLCLGADWELASPDLEGHARERGWWQGEGRLDLAGAYRNPGVPGRISEGRWRRSRELLARAGRGLDVRALQRILRDHADGGPVRLAGSTPDEERYFTLCMHSEPVGTTTASLVAELPADRSRPWPVWISFATPCTGIFLPVYQAGVIPPELARGGESYEADSAWWTFARLEQAASADFALHTPRLRAAWSKLEEEIERERGEVEAAAAAEGDPDAAGKLLSEFMARSAGRALAEARRLTDSLAEG